MTENDLDIELERGVYSKRPLLKAIKLKCMDCCGGSYNEVRECTCADTCFLHPFRLGKNPFSGRVMTPEQREKARERLMAYHRKES